MNLYTQFLAITTKNKRILRIFICTLQNLLWLILVISMLCESMDIRLQGRSFRQFGGFITRKKFDSYIFKSCKFNNDGQRFAHR